MKQRDQSKKHYIQQKVPADSAVENSITFEDAEEMIQTEEAKKEEPNAVVFGVDFFLNVRRTPEIEMGNIITMIPKGTKIIVVDKKPAEDKSGEWYKIKVLDPVLEGYAMKKFIKVY